MEKLITIGLDNKPAPAEAMLHAGEIVGLEGVEKMVLLPDSYTKDKYKDLSYKITIPSSSVIATSPDILYPQFRSRGINCGMAVIALPFLCDEMDDNMLSELAKVLTYPLHYFVAYRLRLPLFPTQEDLTFSDFHRVLEGNISYISERLGIDIDESVFSDFGKSIQKKPLSEVRHLLNEHWLTHRTVRMRHRFGRYFGGNHYFELQRVKEDIPELNLTAGQVVAMIHTGCQGIEAVVRRDLAEKYFYQSTYVPAHKGEEMFDAYFAAQSLLLHYGTIYRHATAALLSRFCKSLGRSGVGLVLDKGHNFVREEKVGDKKNLLYRHNAERITLGEFAIVSGLSNHSSYVVQGGVCAEVTLNTIDHGLGSLIANEDISLDNEVQLVRFKKGIINKQTIVNKAMLSHGTAHSYLSKMKQLGVLDKSVKLEPFWNLKYSK